jgi:hypothetical protein
MRYTTKLGIFSFADGVRDSHAKLIVDTVLGQYFNPDPKGPKLRTVGDAYDFIFSHDSRVLAATEFELVPTFNSKKAKNG